MPIAGTYSWRQTDDFVYVSIPLKGTSPKTVDLFVAETVLKVSFPPFLVDLNLAGVIDEARSKAIRKDGSLHVVLAKSNTGTWTDLLFQGTEHEASQRRQIAIDKRQAGAQNLHEQAKKIMVDEERMALQKQMELERTERRTIEQMKEDEKKAAEEDVYATLAQLEHQRTCFSTNFNNNKGAVLSKGVEGSRLPTVEQQTLAAQKKDCLESSAASSAEHKVNVVGGKCYAKKGEPMDDKILKEADNTEDKDSRQAGENFVRDDDDSDSLMNANGDQYVPLPRARTIAKMTYTPRLFKTPIRESTVRYEQEFIAKNRLHLRKNCLLNKEALDISQSDPLWLKAKGDAFYQSRDFLSAVNAYSAAFEVDKTMIQVLANRAACYLLLGEADSCVSDCTDILEASDSFESQFGSAEEAAAFRQKILVRLGTAHCQLCNFCLGLDSFERACEINPSDEKLQEDLCKVRKWGHASDLKREADEKLRAGDILSAIQIYSEALKVDSAYVSVFSNRAACYLVAGKESECVQDCDAALALLSKREVSSKANEKHQQDRNRVVFTSASGGLIPLPGSKKRRHWVITTLSRRAAAKAQLSDYSGAIKDLEAAKLAVDETNVKAREELESDIARLRTQMKQDSET